ncbi:histidine triad (HIT) protein [Desulfonatronospira thiodismutans ASO3-1]|uniref:Histidine triad (HIT) protein n=1 Tax=Desulfonatronospira thiodismutans ASO3-1 TaxID=555779 RepID=D6SSB8_9BACT|nr:HIT family protein [Desulfonatronospira thiodismutans]EFI33584.1 histidine triad (HIT) protein [Desulfonatronospira thiodismutans ASO3-1]
MQDCIFCKIVRGEIPSAKVYENDSVLCFLDVAPAVRGHSLVIPREHVENILEIPEDMAAHLHEAIRRVGRGIIQGLKADGFNVGMNNFQAAGQVVMHAHWHLIPRFHGDGLQLWPQYKYDNNEEMQDFARKISSAIS